MGNISCCSIDCLTSSPPANQSQPTNHEPTQQSQPVNHEPMQIKLNDIKSHSAPSIAHMTKKMSSHYTVNYPEHEERKTTSIFRKTRHTLINEKKLTCFICGVGSSKDHPLEVHHFYCEKYAQTMINWEKFGEFAKNCYNIQTGEKLAANFDWLAVKQNPDIFVDSVYNMVVLCKQHHTSGNKGIHHVPFPDWILQKYPSDGYEFLT